MLTISHAQTQLDAWLQASLDITEGKTISTAGGTRSITREGAFEIRRQIQYWDSQVKALSQTMTTPYSLVTFKD